MVSSAAVEDLASETWLGVVRGLERFEGNEPAFRAWVFTIARHEVLDWRRRAARRAAEDLPANGLAERAAPDRRPGTVRVLTHRGLRRLAERLGDDGRMRRVV